MVRSLKRGGMVDVGHKPVTAREALAMARVQLSPAALKVLQKQGSPKGDVFETARVAGIMAAKRSAEAIPLCHPLALDKVNVMVGINSEKACVEILAEVKSRGRTGVEMEALHAASIAALTVYDMMKWFDKGMTITDVRLLKKSGGRSGTYRREKDY